MDELFRNSAYFGVAVSIGTYGIGYFLKKKFKWAFLNPLLISVVVTIIVLVAGNIEYETYKQGASFLNYLLTPATVCLAIPLYEQFELLKKHWKAVLASILSGTLTSLLCIFVMSLLWGLNHSMYVTLLPKSITTAMGIGVSEELNGYVTITVAVIMVTGILGNIIGELVIKIFRIRESVSKGVALGTASHAIGTSKAMEIGDVEGARGSLSIAVAGILTVILAPVFANFL